MASRFQAKLGNGKMTLRRRRDVNDIRSGSSQELRQVAEICFYGKSLVELPCHQRFPVADSNHLAALDPLDLRRVGVCDFPASHNGNLKHLVPYPGSSRSRSSFPPSWTPWVSSPVSSSALHCCKPFYS